MSASTATAAAASAQAHELAGKYLTFTLDAEEYGLPVLSVLEIIKMTHITPVPQAPPHVKGVLNLRGRVIPVVDARLKFELQARPYDDRTCIVVISTSVGGRPSDIGVVVDAVSEVLSLTASEIEDTPDFGGRVNTDFVRGIAKVKDRILFLLDLEHVFDGDVRR